VSGRQESPGVRRRSWLEVRWRQFRNAPTPVVRAVTADLAVAIVGGVLLLIDRQSLTHGATQAGAGDLAPAIALFVLAVVVVGSLLTWLWVPQPGVGGGRRRSAWSAMLGLFAALPIAYLVLVVVFQVIGPLLG
jgi:cytochrome bd-type quinol oxidase subunit 2